MQGLAIAQKAIDDGFESVNIYQPKQLTGLGKAFVSGGIGKPEAIQNPVEFGKKMTILLTKLNVHLRKSGSHLQGILPVEAGPINGLLPIYNVHAYNKKQTDPKCKIWLFDCDGAGRAVPALTTLMYDYFHAGTSPITYNFKDDNGDTKNVILQSPGDTQEDTLNGYDAEQVIHDIRKSRLRHFFLTEKPINPEFVKM